MVQDGRRTLTSSESELSVGFKYIIIKEDGYPFSTNASNILYDNSDSGLRSANVQDAIDEMNEVVEEIKDIVEVEEMPTPSEENEGTIIQYKGETTSDFTH